MSTRRKSKQYCTFEFWKPEVRTWNLNRCLAAALTGHVKDKQCQMFCHRRATWESLHSVAGSISSSTWPSGLNSNAYWRPVLGSYLQMKCTRYILNWKAIYLNLSHKPTLLFSSIDEKSQWCTNQIPSVHLRHWLASIYPWSGYQNHIHKSELVKTTTLIVISQVRLLWSPRGLVAYIRLI